MTDKHIFNVLSRQGNEKLERKSKTLSVRFTLTCSSGATQITTFNTIAMIQHDSRVWQLPKKNKLKTIMFTV